MKYTLIFLILTTALQAQVQLRYTENQTLTYEEVIQAYQELSDSYGNAWLQKYGPTDSGRQLHVLYLSSAPIGSEDDVKRLKKTNAVLLINNGIHAGESCGIDASIEFSRELLQNGVPENVLIAIIPVYNIGGALNRGSYSRANQQGPEEHGFRGNARNLDLNRDFIKADALNTFSFYAIYQHIKPHIFVDTHTSNGADYQYTMTLISTQKDKLNPVLATVLQEDLEPYLYQKMEASGYEMVPYVNVFGTTPDEGFAAFLETPRYATGYTALFNTIGFVTETHMLKPYKERVLSTWRFLSHLTNYASANSEKLKKAKNEAESLDGSATSFAVNWTLDSGVVEKRNFKGYEYGYYESEIGHYGRLMYHSDQPKTYKIPYYPDFKTTHTVTVPQYYVVPQAWREVVLRLQYNNVEMEALARDTTIRGVEYRIDSAQFSDRPYEGHFPVRDFKVHKKEVSRQFLKGDLLVPMNRDKQRFITAVLEPAAVDSYLRWNFFDIIFQQKEHFSAYVFEDTAGKLLEGDKALRKAFYEWSAQNPEEFKDPYSVLNFIYQRSPYYEKEHLRYPVMRVE